MPDYGRPLEFGISIDPTADAVDEQRRLARRADELGLDLVGVQDHPYQRRFLETFSLIATLLAETTRVRVFPDVANVPLRPPAMLAKAAASLDVLSGGRFELGMGAGGFPEAVAAMGGPSRTPGEAVEALEEAIHVIRFFWTAGRGLRFEGRHYRLAGVNAGPPPAHPIGIWLGAYKPRMLALAGRLADGWIPSLGYLPPEEVPDAASRVDDAATAAGRDPREIRRAYNLGGEVAVGELTRFALELGFDTFILWPGEDGLRQVERFAADVAPAVREAVEAERRR